MRYYAGIGSRETPEVVLDFFYKLGYFFGIKGFTLRSGAAQGADKCFERGADVANGKKEIYLPWGSFEGSDSKLIVSNIEAYNIAKKFHPYWHNLSVGAKKLQSRNSHQVLGWDLRTPSSFIVCWTKNGKDQGGTGQAIRIARQFDIYNPIPVFDAGEYNTIDETKSEMKKFLIENDIFSEDELTRKN